MTLQISYSYKRATLLKNSDLCLDSQEMQLEVIELPNRPK